MSVIDEYLKKIEPSKRKQLIKIREIAMQIIPTATETISYGMPTLQYNGKSFLGFDAHINHLGIYPYGGEEITIFKEKLTKLNFKFSKGAIQIPYENPIPKNLLREIIQHRIKRIP